MNKNDLDLVLSLDDMTSIAAVCGVMSVMILKSSELTEKYIKESAHLASLHSRIEKALRKASKMKSENSDDEKKGN